MYYLAEQLTWQQLPLELQAPSAIEALATGDKDVTLALLEFLYHICHPESDSCRAGHVPPAGNTITSDDRRAAKQNQTRHTSVPAAASTSLSPAQQSTESAIQHRTTSMSVRNSIRKAPSKPISASQPLSRSVSAPQRRGITDYR